MGSAPDVQLRMPAVPGNIGLTRLVAAALGSQANLPIEDVDELRMAVDELSYWLIGAPAAGACREFEIRFTMGPGSVLVRGTTAGPGWDDGSELGHGLSALSMRILDALADDYECICSEGTRRFSLLKLSRS